MGRGTRTLSMRAQSDPDQRIIVVSALAHAGIDTEHLAEISMDGDRFFAAFELNAREVARRVTAGVLSEPDLSVLYALKSVPESQPVATSSLGPEDLATLRDAPPGFAKVNARTVTRLYRPAGTVRAVAVLRQTATDALRQIAQMPPIFQRLAVGATGEPSADVICRAQALGVGVVTLQPSPAVRVPASQAQAGVPAVYRWWIAEIAVRNWIRRTEPTARAGALG